MMEAYFRVVEPIRGDGEAFYRDIWQLIVKHLEWPELVALQFVNNRTRTAAKPLLNARLQELQAWLKDRYKFYCNCGKHSVHPRPLGGGCSVFTLRGPDADFKMRTSDGKIYYNDWGTRPLRDIAVIIRGYRLGDKYEWANRVQRRLGNAWVRYGRICGLLNINLLRAWKK